MIFILALCLLFSVIENLCSLGRTATFAERIDIREHQRADLTPNARVCLHAERTVQTVLFLCEPLCDPSGKERKDGIDDDPNEKGFIPANIGEHEDHACYQNNESWHPSIFQKQRAENANQHRDNRKAKYNEKNKNSHMTNSL